MTKHNGLMKAIAEAGYDWLNCPIPGCSAYGELALRSWVRHLYMAHLTPEPMRRCPYSPCTVVSRNPGMRVHIRSHEGS